MFFMLFFTNRVERSIATQKSAKLAASYAIMEWLVLSHTCCSKNVYDQGNKGMHEWRSAPQEAWWWTWSCCHWASKSTTFCSLDCLFDLRLTSIRFLILQNCTCRRWARCWSQLHCDTGEWQVHHARLWHAPGSQGCSQVSLFLFGSTAAPFTLPRHESLSNFSFETEP